MVDNVVITGTGLITSLGPGVSETWDALISGRTGIRQIDTFDVQGFDCKHAAEVQGLGPEDLNIHPRDSRIMDKHAYMLMKSSRDAFSKSRLDTGSVAPEDIGFFAGMGMVDYNIEDILTSILNSRDQDGMFEYDRFFSGGYREIHPLWPLSMLNNISFCQVAIDLGIKGENSVFSPHGDSGIHAIIEAYNVVSEKRAKVALAGGVSEKISPLSIARASLSGILNISANEDDLYCRPFGKYRKGTILGEGSGMFTLELNSSAENRQRPRLASIAGYGTSFEMSEDSNCPTAGAISLSMENAMASADFKPSDIDLIIAHGDGTFDGDKNESEAIHQTFADCIKQINVYSSKGSLGNLLAGAPAVDVILGICILKNGIIPAVFNALPLDSDIIFNVVSQEPLKSYPKKILINSRSHEGQCASIIIEKADQMS
jgi:3-oxoacyl-[acyl-carrier-protein] synthase II